MLSADEADAEAVATERARSERVFIREDAGRGQGLEGESREPVGRVTVANVSVIPVYARTLG